MKKIVLIVAGTLFVASSGYTQPLSKKNVELFSGYPLCEILFNNWIAEKDLQIARAVYSDSTVREAYAELIRSAQFTPRERPETDIPEEPATSGFVNETSISQLNGEAFEHVLIGQIREGDYVLANLADQTRDPDWQEPCWDRVVDVRKGWVTRDDDLRVITYSNERNASFTIRATPKHRFYMLEPHWGWTEADAITTGSLLTSDGEAGFQVLANGVVAGAQEPNTDAGKFFQSLEVYRPLTYVYDLKTVMGTYYVGLPHARLLVHSK